MSEVTTGELVHLEVGDGVATVALDSPSNRNALSTRLVSELHARLTAAIGDEAVRVIVLTATGPVFCAGADLKERREGSEPQRGSGSSTPPAVPFPDVLSLIWNSPKPVIARLNGPARAGGIGLVAACDIAVAPDTATFAFTEVRLGVVPGVIAVTCLRRMQPQAASEYFLTGETFDGPRAVEIGLLNRAVPADELDPTVDRYTRMLLRGAPEALAITKELVREVPGMPLDEGFSRMAALSEQRFASAEGREGVAAFAKRRDPAWVILGNTT